MYVKCVLLARTRQFNLRPYICGLLTYYLRWKPTLLQQGRMGIVAGQQTLPI